VSTSSNITFNTSSTLFQCHSWLRNYNWTNGTDIRDVNHVLLQRHIGGLTLLGCLDILGLLGNTLVLWIYAMKFRASNYRTYVIWLTSLDMVNCVVVMPFYIFYLCLPVMMENNVLCKFGRCMGYMATLSSAFVLIVIAVDRYRKVCSPARIQLTSKQAQTCCFIALFLALLISWPSSVMFGTSSLKVGLNDIWGQRCYMEENFIDSTYMAVFQVFMSAVAFIITVTLTTLYSLIVHSIYKHRRNFTGSQASTDSRLTCVVSASALERSTRKSTMTLLAVTMTFVLSALPHHILAIAFFINKNFECNLGLSGGLVYYTFVWLIFFNTAVNPFIYGFSDKRFRRHLIRASRKLKVNARTFSFRPTTIKV